MIFIIRLISCSTTRRSCFMKNPARTGEEDNSFITNKKNPFLRDFFVLSSLHLFAFFIAFFHFSRQASIRAATSAFGHILQVKSGLFSKPDITSSYNTIPRFGSHIIGRGLFQCHSVKIALFSHFHISVIILITRNRISIYIPRKSYLPCPFKEIILLPVVQRPKVCLLSCFLLIPFALF